MTDHETGNCFTVSIVRTLSDGSKKPSAQTQIRGWGGEDYEWLPEGSRKQTGYRNPSQHTTSEADL